MAVIQSSANERLKRVRKLRKRRARDDEGVFVIEGYREVRRAVDAGIEIEELFFAPAFYQGANEPALVTALASPSHEVAAEPFTSVTTRDRPDGLLAVARQFDTSLARQRIDESNPALLLVAEGVERPGNLGTMLRAACAAGVTGVIACDPQTDVFAPEVVRASVGTLFLQPVSVASAADTAAWLREHGVRIVTGAPDAEGDYWDEDLRPATAVVVGSEQHGVTPLWFDAADAVVRIPMVGPVDSVNVAVAASVLLFDAVRQRAAAR
jgi:TrmH family RNA methyltransferase